jgi:hypothetical protein
MTSRCDPSLLDHTTLKSTTSLKLHAYLALAPGGACLVIDASDPIGTLNAEVFERMGEVFAETSRCEPYLGGELCSDVAVYLSLNSKYDPADGGKPADLVGRGTRTLTAAQGAARALARTTCPSTSSPRTGSTACHRGGADRRRYRALSEHEALQIKQFVEAGAAVCTRAVAGRRRRWLTCSASPLRVIRRSESPT